MHKKVYHAYWPNKGFCVALKKYIDPLDAGDEINVLQYFNNLPEEHRNHIIYMHGYGQSLQEFYSLNYNYVFII